MWKNFRLKIHTYMYTSYIYTYGKKKMEKWFFFKFYHDNFFYLSGINEFQFLIIITLCKYYTEKVFFVKLHVSHWQFYTSVKTLYKNFKIQICNNDKFHYFLLHSFRTKKLLLHFTKEASSLKYYNFISQILNILNLIKLTKLNHFEIFFVML